MWICKKNGDAIWHACQLKKLLLLVPYMKKKVKLDESCILFSEDVSRPLNACRSGSISEVSKQCASAKHFWKYHTYLYCCLDSLAMHMRALTCWCYCAVLASWFKYKQMSILLYIRGLYLQILVTWPHSPCWQMKNCHEFSIVFVCMWTSSVNTGCIPDTWPHFSLQTN